MSTRMMTTCPSCGQWADVATIRPTAAQQKIAELEAELKDERWQVSVQDQERQKAYKLLTAERQRRESAEADRRELLVMLAARPDITRLFGFKEREICEAARKRNNGETANASDSEERGG